jgi:hypothetical protein
VVRIAWAFCGVTAAVVLLWFGWHQYRVRAGAEQARLRKVGHPTAALIANESIRLAPGKSQLTDGTLVELTDDAQGTLVVDAHRSTLEFDRGRLEIQVAHQLPGHSFAVRTAGVEFTVLGTRFSVVAQGSRVELNVTEGKVLVKNSMSQPTIVQAGGHWSNRDPSNEIPSVAATAARPVKPPAPTSMREGPSADKANDVSTCRDYLRDGRPQAAQDCYLSFASGGGLSAEMALYEVARLRRDVLSNLSASLVALDDYDARFPSGTFAPEVHMARVELLSRLGRFDEALKVSEQLLASPGGHSRTTELRLLRGNLLRDKRHDCAAAIAEYQRIESDRGPRGDQAQFAQANCLERLGRKSEAIEAYTRYLQRSQPAQAERAQQRLLELTQ